MSDYNVPTYVFTQKELEHDSYKRLNRLLSSGYNTPTCSLIRNLNMIPKRLNRLLSSGYRTHAAASGCVRWNNHLPTPFTLGNRENKTCSTSMHTHVIRHTQMHTDQSCMCAPTHMKSTFEHCVVEYLRYCISFTHVSCFSRFKFTPAHAYVHAYIQQNRNNPTPYVDVSL